jgi:hypothetical protein
MKIRGCIIFALLFTFAVPATFAGQSRTSFAVSVRVLPRCDAGRHGGIIENANGTARCVYPRIAEVQSIAELPAPPRITTNDKAELVGVTVRTITY